MQIVLINGKNTTKLSVFERISQFGDGLFETCLLKNSKLLFWQQHFARLEKGRKQLGINPVAQKLWLADSKQAIKLLNANNGVLKFIISRGQSLRGYGITPNMQPSRIVIASPILTKIPSLYTLDVCQSGYGSNPLLAGIKHCNRLEQVLAYAKKKADDCIMLDPENNVISTTCANIFALKGNTLITPDLSLCGIDGTRRQIVLKLAEALCLQTKIARLSMAQLLAADEIFISNSIIGIRPVSKINQQSFTTHTITHKIIAAFSTLIDNHDE